MAVTIKDVARVANVTPTVVSRVLHNKASTVRVSAATAERVRLAASQLGYRVNVMARNFRDRRTMTIGVLNGRGLARPSFAKGPRYFASLMDGIVDRAFHHGYSVTLCPQLLGERPEEGMADGRFDGFLWYSIDPTEETLHALDQCEVPMVIIHAHAHSFANRWPTVIADNHQGLGLAVDHLVQMGHQRIGFALDRDAMNVESAERLAAFQWHMSRVGLAHSDCDIVRFGQDRSDLHAYFSKGALPHSALIVHADGLASELVVAAQQHGHTVPSEFAVIGFDSTDFCNEIRPSLTSISQPLFDLGGSAVDRLIELIGNHEVTPFGLVLPCGLDIRGSTRPEPDQTERAHVGSDPQC